ncbi:MAG: PDR/VanB family oxidoreductase [Rhodosalinus sp.]
MTIHRLRLEARTPLTDRIAEFTLAPAEGGALPAWQPGAHLRVSLPGGGDRAYSLVTFGPVPEAPQHYTIAVQREDDGQGGSRFMHGLTEGDEVEATTPKCDFPVEAGKPALLLAGGIGITPMVSMAHALKAAGTPFALHYAGRAREQMAYRDALAESLGDALHCHFDEEAGGPLDLAGLIGGMGGEQHLYVCGPRPMIDAALAQAEACGIPRDSVHVELFDNASAGAEEGDDSFEVEVASTGEVVTVPPGKSIIEALEEAGHDLIYDCQRGDCGICQTDVLEGVPDHRDVVLSEAERAEGKVMQICVSRAKTPRLKLDL